MQKERVVRVTAPYASDWIDARVLAADTSEAHPIPEGAKQVIFSSTEAFYVKFGESDVVAAIPVADVTDGSGSELNPIARSVPDGATHIGLVSPATCIVTMSFYS